MTLDKLMALPGVQLVTGPERQPARRGRRRRPTPAASAAEREDPDDGRCPLFGAIDPRLTADPKAGPN